MSDISDKIHEKCLAFSDRIIKLNDYLLKEAANAKPSYKIVKGKRVYEKAVPVYLQRQQEAVQKFLREYYMWVNCGIYKHYCKLRS